MLAIIQNLLLTIAVGGLGLYVGYWCCVEKEHMKSFNYTPLMHPVQYYSLTPEKRDAYDVLWEWSQGGDTLLHEQVRMGLGGGAVCFRQLLCELHEQSDNDAVRVAEVLGLDIWATLEAARGGHMRVHADSEVHLILV